MTLWARPRRRAESDSRTTSQTSKAARCRLPSHAPDAKPEAGRRTANCRVLRETPTEKVKQGTARCACASSPKENTPTG